mgnify:CR=1 FL=1
MKKLRILEILIIIAIIKITPIAINYANEIRHYKAFGGEYLIPILGLLTVFGIETEIDIKKQLS